MALTELQQVNAFIALSKRVEGWPSTLADHGYTLDRIELKFSVSDPHTPGVSRVVNPDLLFVADVRNCSLIVELKSGGYHHHTLEQMDRLVGIKPQELIRDGRVTLQRPSPSTILKHKISVALVINHEYLEEYLVEVKPVNHSSTLISISEESIKSHHGELEDKPLDAEFKRGVDITQCHPVTKLIKVLPTTNDKNELVNAIVNAVMELWVRSERVVGPIRVAEKLFAGFWDLFDNDAQKRFLQVVHEVLSDMRQTEFNGYLGSVPGKRDEWKLLKLPETEGKNRTKAYQAFQRAALKYKWRQQKGIDFEGARHFDQPTFWDVEGLFEQPDA